MRDTRHRSARTGALLTALAAALLSGTTPTRAAEAAPAASIVDAARGTTLGAWAENVFPELDEVATTHRDVVAYVYELPGDRIGVASTAPEKARSLLSGRLDTLRVSSTARAKVEVVPVERSYADLLAIMDDVADSKWMDEFGSRLMSIDHENNRVILTAVKNPDQRALQDLAARYGSGVAVEIVESDVEFASGSERYQDRYPYWGGAGIATAGWSDLFGAVCTAGIPMRKSNGQDIIVTAGHCASGSSVRFYSLSGSTPPSWSNLLGSTSGYRNTFNEPVSGYADIVAWPVSKAEGVIWVGGKRTTSSLDIKEWRGGTPAYDTPLCTSGATTGQVCTFRVNGGDHYLNFGNGRIGPFIQARITGSCIAKGDSGGPVYQSVSGGVRVYGTITAFEPTSTGCLLYYSRLTDPERLYDAVPILS